jgi:hypothetical protein
MGSEGYVAHKRQARNQYEFLPEITKERDSLEDLSVDGRMTPK